MNKKKKSSYQAAATLHPPFPVVLGTFFFLLGEKENVVREGREVSRYLYISANRKRVKKKF